MSKTKNIYLAIIVSLSAHAVVLAGLYFYPMMDTSGVEFNEPLEQGVDMKLFELIELVDSETLQQPGEEAVNEVKNVNSELTDTRVSYSGQKQITDDTYQDLKELERQFFEEAAASRSEEDTYQADIPEGKDREMYEYVDKSFAGPVMVEYDVNSPIRKHMVKNVPVYKCQGSGTVTVNITVNQMGTVVSADINPSQSTTLNECLTMEALQSSKKWVFDSSFSHPKKQEGVIIYRFQAQ